MGLKLPQQPAITIPQPGHFGIDSGGTGTPAKGDLQQLLPDRTHSKGANVKNGEFIATFQREYRPAKKERQEGTERQTRFAHKKSLVDIVHKAFDVSFRR